MGTERSSPHRSTEPAHEPCFHFSVDDVFDSLIEVSERGTPLFTHPFFAFLNDLHRAFGVAVDLYLFLAQKNGGRTRTLAGVSDHIRAELQAARWLRLGPHGLDRDTPPHVQAPAAQRRVFDAIYREIERFAGPGKTTSWVRLHFFSESYDITDYWRERGVTTLLLTDKPAVAYRLPLAKRTVLARSGVAAYRGMTLRRTHERVEKLVRDTASGIRERFDRHLDRHGFLCVLTHENALRDQQVRCLCRTCARYARDRGLIQPSRDPPTRGRL